MTTEKGEFDDVFKKVDAMKKADMTKFFKGLGFKKEFPDNVDKKAFWWIKKHPHHKYFKNLEIVVEKEKTIVVWCTEQDVLGRNDVAIIKRRFTKKGLTDITQYLNRF
ncbi:MAG: hypothetical protein AABY22_06620 [Nanoarchaeota archaeon]